MKKKTNQTDILIASLGGLGAVGMNCYIVEQNDEIIIMDAGILFANGETPGVDYIIPDFTYLKENESKIKALFVTHGHEDHIGSFPFLLEKVKNGLFFTIVHRFNFNFSDTYLLADNFVRSF